MRHSHIGWTLVLSCLAFVQQAVAVSPLGTAFTYQGKLESGGFPVNGTADFQFTLWSALSGPDQVAGPVAANNVSVTDGLFTVTIDFGSSVFNGDARWLEIAARTPAGSGSFTALTPRQPLSAAPYALQTRGLFYEDGASRLGIGTNTPTHRLTVDGGGLFVDDTAEEGVSLTSAEFVFENAETQHLAYRYRSSPERHDFYTGGNNAMIIVPPGFVGIGTTAPSWPLHVVSNQLTLVRAEGTSTVGQTTTGYFSTASDAGNAVFANATATTGSATGVRAYTSAPTGIALYGRALNGSGTNFGVYGETSSANGYAGYFTGGKNYFQGSVGVGTTTPAAKLSVDGPESTGFSTGTVQLRSPGGTLGHFMTLDGDEINGWSGLHLNPNASTHILMAEGGGNVGIGTSSPASALDVVGRIRLRQDVPPGGGNSAGIDLYQQNPAEDRAFIGMRDDNQVGLYGRGGSGWSFVMDVNNGNIGIGTTSPQAKLDVNGTARCDILEITGADLAEKFPVSESARPGLVMEIDPENPGKLRVSSGEYNRRVAGVVSGANGLSAGTVMGHLPGSEDQPAIALSGRVWVSCDAAREPIEVGDLLTTSSMPGHAMKVVDYPRAQGAAIGKAMTALPRGEIGFVLVLVNLQ